jgi:hypothetical protein
MGEFNICLLRRGSIKYNAAMKKMASSGLVFLT